MKFDNRSKSFDLTKADRPPARGPVNWPWAEADNLIAHAAAIAVPELTEEQLPEARDIIEKAIYALDTTTTDIRINIEAAHERRERRGEFADARWWQKAHSALRYRPI